jgi:hypothetical protein
MNIKLQSYCAPQRLDNLDGFFFEYLVIYKDMFHLACTSLIHVTLPLDAGELILAIPTSDLLPILQIYS